MSNPGLLRPPRVPGVSSTQVQQRVKLVVVDDSRLYREALIQILAGEPWVEAMMAEIDARGALESDAITSPRTITLLNMAMDQSFDSLAALHRAGACVIVVGAHDSEAEVIACAEAGAAGYLLRSDSLEHLCELIQAVARGETICSPRVAAVLLRRVAALAAERRSESGLGLLTAREAEILALVEQGFANAEIAQRLSIQVRTVKNHVHAILGKLGVERRGQAAARARLARAPAPRT